MSSTTSATPKRVIVIGAGWAGLIAAKTYLEIDPTINLTIIDAEKSLGGVWCSDRVYPGFTADGPVGLFDYSDLPMQDVVGLKNWAELPGDKVHDYLVAYAKKFGLIERLMLDTRVEKIARGKDKNGWVVKIEGKEEGMVSDKLVMATGLTSKPNWPDIPRSDFEQLVFHSRDVGLHHEYLTSQKVNRATVYGGCKSAIDAINLCVLAGKKVDWVIREDGNGAGLMVDVRKWGIHGGRFIGRWKNVAQPSIFSTDSFWYRFLHSEKSKLGTKICSHIWDKTTTTPLSMEPYRTKSPNMKKLIPETGDGLFFTAAVSAMHCHDEFFKNLHEGGLIEVHRATITSMSGSTVQLSNGSSLTTDAVVFATGWDTKVELFDPALALELGISTLLEHQDTETAKYWEDLHVEADKEVLEVLPRLGRQPQHHQRPVDHTPTRLFRHIAPSSFAAENNRSIIFLGMVTSIQTSIYAEVSALWGVAYMEGLLYRQHTTKRDMDYDIAKVNAWCARRYLSRGQTRQIAAGEIQDVIDVLMKDLGLKVARKRNWVADQFVPYRNQDYKGIVQEVVKRKELNKLVLAEAEKQLG